ncbi:hypothetical protein ABMA28_012432 [Loxostege sticticalis]|uniref:Reverse transcriptase domain-containing protein n=1 Tax=Loxostege sticticalis TaxID=481309 RepID=A0ABD0S3U2_LOXSC
MNENSIIRLCATSFSCQDVEAAKDLLYDSAQVKDKKIKRKGKAEVKVQKDVEDIISLIKSTPAECFPIFVARDIRKLPPVTFDHVDVSRLLKDIIILQDQVQDIKQRYATNEQLNDLKHEFVNLRQESLINNIEPLNYVNMKRGYKRTMQLENHETDSGPFGILNITHDNEQERVDFTADDRARTANREILSEEVIAERAETEILPSVSHTNRPSARAGVLGAAAIQSVEAPTVVSHAVSMVETKVALPMASPSSVRMSAERLEQKTSMNTCNELAPISLATVVAKVLDGLLDHQLSKCIELNECQFGFRSGLSTETAILRLKHTVQYYTTRKTPVYACFLDLSKAFDLVSYNVLWDKLRRDTNTPGEVINLLKYWYHNQTNTVRWAGSHSSQYSLECGVRQGGLSSPRLFNLYVNGLIDELSRAGVGCSIDGKMVNNISYADDMVLLSPSVRALEVLVGICERYALSHGLKYNTTKSEILVFKAGKKSPHIVPPVRIGDVPLRRVTKFKYLGHWVTEDLTDDEDMERERRALSVRCNMVIRRFSGSFNALRIQYNRSFRMLMGLPRFCRLSNKVCSASGMFAEAKVDCFYTIIRKRVASLMRRIRVSPFSLLNSLLERLDCPIIRHWNRVHMCANVSGTNYRFDNKYKSN